MTATQITVVYCHKDPDMIVIHLPVKHGALISTNGFQFRTQQPSYELRVVFSKPVHATRVRIGPPGANHGPFTAKPSSCHEHTTQRVTPPTSSCRILSVDTELACKHAETIFPAQCAA